MVIFLQYIKKNCCNCFVMFYCDAKHSDIIQGSCHVCCCLVIQDCFCHILPHFWWFLLYIKKRVLLKQAKKIHFKSSFHSWDNQILTSDIHISLLHQMPKHEAQNIFYWITSGLNTVWWWNLDSLCNITKENILWKISLKNMA